MLSDEFPNDFGRGASISATLYDNHRRSVVARLLHVCITQGKWPLRLPLVCSLYRRLYDHQHICSHLHCASNPKTTDQNNPYPNVGVPVLIKINTPGVYI